MFKFDYKCFYFVFKLKCYWDSVVVCLGLCMLKCEDGLKFLNNCYLV